MDLDTVQDELRELKKKIVLLEFANASLRAENLELKDTNVSLSEEMEVFKSESARAKEKEFEREVYERRLQTLHKLWMAERVKRSYFEKNFKQEYDGAQELGRQSELWKTRAYRVSRQKKEFEKSADVWKSRALEKAREVRQFNKTRPNLSSEEGILVPALDSSGGPSLGDEGGGAGFDDPVSPCPITTSASHNSLPHTSTERDLECPLTPIIPLQGSNLVVNLRPLCRICGKILTADSRNGNKKLKTYEARFALLDVEAKKLFCEVCFRML